MGIDRRFGGAAHSRLVILVVLRMAASALAPSAPTLLFRSLRARRRVETVREQACQWALTER